MFVSIYFQSLTFSIVSLVPGLGFKVWWAIVSDWLLNVTLNVTLIPDDTIEV